MILQGEIRKLICFPFLLSLLLISVSGSVLINSLQTGNQPAVDFIQTLLTFYRPFHENRCNLFVVQDREDNSAAVSKLISYSSLRLQLPSYTVKYAYPTESQIASLLHDVQEFHIPASNISAALRSSSTLPVKFPITVKNYRKKSDPCLVVILFVEDDRPEFISQVSKLLSPVYIPITRKDEDYFIFLSKKDKLDNLLNMREYPARVKFKLGLNYGDLEDEKLEVKTVCFFCLEGGNPMTFNLPYPFEKDVDYFPDMVQNLNGKTLHVSLPYIRARIEADAPWQGVKNARRGIWKILFEEYLNLKFNFSYNMFVSTGKDGRFGGGGTGFQLPNGTWIGVTGDLVSGKADIGIVTANTPKRIHYIDFTNSFFDIGFLTFVTSEGSRVFSPLALLWPFTIFMWFLIFVSTLVAFVVFTVIIKTIFWLDMGSSESLNFARRGMVSQQIWNFKYQLQFVLTSFLDQDCVMPTFTPLRTFCAIWLFFTLVLTTLYRSKLVSLLAFPIMEKLPEDFDQLAYSDYTVGFMKHGDSAYNTLAASTDPVYVKLVNEMEIFSGVGLECLEKVVTAGKYGCIAYDFALRHLKERNLSETDTMKLVFAPAHTYNIFLGLATEGKSIYRLNFGKQLSYTRAFHLADVWEMWDMHHTVRTLKRDWWMSTNQTEKMQRSQAKAGEDDLTLKHISGSFYILVALLAICIVIFVMELLTFRSKKWRKVWKKVKGSLKIFCDRAFVLSRRRMDEYT